MKYALVALLAALIIVPIGTYVYFVRDLTSKENILNRKNAGVVLLDRNDQPFFSFYEAKTKKVVTLTNIPEHTRHAVIAVEDREFFNHPGFSIRGIGRAIVQNVRNEEIVSGGSTISQQLVKNALLTHQQTFLRKYQEVVLALEIERRFSKEDILEMYLNTVYFGEGAFGIEMAAETYFDKKANELTLGESALLTGILPAPSALSPLSGNRERAFEKQAIVLSEMQKQGFITATEKEKALAEKVTFNTQSETINVTAPHFALMVKDELIEKYGEQKVAGSGFTVKTTLDLTKQEEAQAIVANQVQRLAGNKVTNAAAIVINPKTGEVLALVGSHNWNDTTNGKINMAVRPRQPGSSFKPIVYTKALQDRIITAATQLDDKEITFPGGYKPKNYDNRFRGQVLTRFALANSLNIPALHVLDKVGVPDAIDFAEDLGITTLQEPERYGLSMVLGAVEVPLIEMTSAFGTFGNEGKHIPPTTIISIQDKRKKTIYTYTTPTAKQVVNPGAAFLVSSILSDNAARAEVFGGSLSISRPAAVKTGTTENYRDALTIGYTPSLAVGVWVGNNDNTPMDTIAGSLGAAPIWRQLMELFLRGTPVERFRQPIQVDDESICKENGLLAKVATSSAYTEFFLSGTTPTKECNVVLPTPTSEATPTPEKDGDDEEKPTDTPTPTEKDKKTPTPTPEEFPTPTIIPTEVTGL